LLSLIIGTGVLIVAALVVLMVAAIVVDLLFLPKEKGKGPCRD
jgi:hypothetical protein